MGFTNNQSRLIPRAVFRHRSAPVCTNWNCDQAQIWDRDVTSTGCEYSFHGLAGWTVLWVWAGGHSLIRGPKTSIRRQRTAQMPFGQDYTPSLAVPLNDRSTFTPSWADKVLEWPYVSPLVATRISSWCRWIYYKRLMGDFNLWRESNNFIGPSVVPRGEREKDKWSLQVFYCPPDPPTGMSLWFRTDPRQSSPRTRRWRELLRFAPV